jgi:SAM-dependent methyltransferase
LTIASPPGSAARTRIEPYLDLLRDPMDGGRLRLEPGEPPTLLGETSGLRYRYVRELPDLRPIPGRPNRWGEVISADAASAHARIRDHYDETPCHDHLSLVNVPLGRYLRQPEYDPYFADVKLAVEVGSGKGAIASVLKQHRGITPLCIDQAYGSLRHVLAPPLSADAILGSNLSLPLADGIADLVISYGVIHHTPDPLRAFSECARILKPGGRMLLGVYNWENLYRSLYFAVSPPLKGVRHLFGRKVGDRILKSTIFPPYYLALWAVLGKAQGNWQRPDAAQAWEQFGDFFLTPIARFYHAEELRTLGDLLGLDLLEQDTGGWPGNGFSHFAWYQKRA